MKKILLSVFAAGLLVACTEDITTNPEGPVAQTVKVNVADFQSADGMRTTIDTDGKFSWAAGDQMGVFPLQTTLEDQTSQQIIFKINDNTPATTATFNGTGWGLVTGADVPYKYFAYYPYSDVNKNPTKIAVEYEDGLNQVANNSTAHLPVNDFMYAPAIKPASISEAEFSFKHISALVHFSLELPDTAKAKTFSLLELSVPKTETGAEMFIKSFKYSPLEIGDSLKPEMFTDTVTTNRITLHLNGVEGFTPNASGKIDAWLLLPPVAFDNTPVTLRLYTPTGDVYATESATFAAPLTSQELKTFNWILTASSVEGIDLCDNGTANCYVVNQGSTKYNFRADIKGNGVVPALPKGVTDAYNVKNIDLTDAKACVLWETDNTSGPQTVGSIITSAKLVGNRIVIQTANPFKEGNALISLYKEIDGVDGYTAGDKILWSWHIWATTTDFDATAQTLGDVQMMDRNLGALSADSTETVLNQGFHYQWGRPFPIMSKQATTNYKWPEDGASFTDTTSVTIGTLAYSAQYPTRFICASADNHDNWYFGSSPAFWGGDDTNTKTMYDPCPPGWKVPGENGTAKTVWESNFTKDNSTLAKTYKGRYLNSNENVYYPFSGYRSVANSGRSGQLNNVGSYGIYWSSTPFSNSSCLCLVVNSTNVSPTQNFSRAAGFSLRPCKDVTE